MTFVPSICDIEGRNWKAMDSSGGVDLKNPIDQAWRAGEAVRKTIKKCIGIAAYVIPVVVKTIKKCIGIAAYVIPVVVFLNMAENAAIKACDQTPSVEEVRRQDAALLPRRSHRLDYHLARRL